MKTAAQKRHPIPATEPAEAELRQQLLLIESMLRDGRSEREIVAALEDG